MALLTTWLSATDFFQRPKEIVQADAVVTVLYVEQGNDGNRITVSTGEGDIVFFTDTLLVAGQQVTVDIFRNVGRSDGRVARNVRTF